MDGVQEVVATLLGRGANPRAQDKGGFMPHHDAASKGRLNTLRVLLRDKRTPINEGVHDGLSALHLASAEDKQEVVDLLISFGADVEKPSYVVRSRCWLSTVLFLPAVEGAIS